jgi:hypothetical protein
MFRQRVEKIPVDVAVFLNESRHANHYPKVFNAPRLCVVWPLAILFRWSQVIQFSALIGAGEQSVQKCKC